MRQRLDLALEQRGLAPSRARARDAILRGTVKVNGLAARKPNQQVSAEDIVTMADPAAGYVSRAALKLIAGLDAANLDVAGKTCLDIGASTGGFTQVLLERGAARIYALDVGHDQLHQSLRTDPRVVSFEGFNAREISREQVPDPVDLLVCDISFVSVEKVLAAPLALCGPAAHALILVKPQFEVGREGVGKGGIVTDQTVRQAALERVIAWMAVQGFALELRLPSPLSGGDGNLETISVFERV